MKIVFMGTPDFASTILSELNKEYEIALVVSQPDREKKKGKIIPTSVHQKAIDLGLEVFQPENIKDDYERILETKAEVLITAAYGQYIPSKILKQFKYCLNVHGSILPLHRGGAPIQRSLINGDTKTGVTIVEMAKKLDAGKIYSIEELEILDTDNSSSLFEKLAVIGAKLLLKTLPDILSGKNKGIPQDEALHTYSPNIAKNEEIISFNKTSKEIINQIRGLAYNPGAYFIFKDTNVKVYKAKESLNYNDELPGTILNIKKEIVIKTKDSAIILEEVLLPGKKIISGKDFANGQKLFSIGDIIE